MMIISKRSWHYRLLNMLGWVPSWHRTSLCPYFWKLVVAVTLVFGVAPYLAMGTGLDAYAVLSPGVNAVYEKDYQAQKAEAIKEGKDPEEAVKPISPAASLMIHWNIKNHFLDWFITVSMLIGVVCWLAIVAFLVFVVGYLLRAGFELLTEHTTIAPKVGRTVGRAVGATIGRPARATGTVFSNWWRAHKEKHCPLIDFVDD